MNTEHTIQGFSNPFKTEKPEDARLKSGEVTQVEDMVSAKYETRILTLEKQINGLSIEFNTFIPPLTRRAFVLEQRLDALEKFCSQIHNLDMAMIVDIATVQSLIEKLKELNILDAEYPMPNPRRPRVAPLRPPAIIPAASYQPPPTGPPVPYESVEPSAPFYPDPTPPE
jgi:hypothetical protein